MELLSETGADLSWLPLVLGIAGVVLVGGIVAMVVGRKRKDDSDRS